MIARRLARTAVLAAVAALALAGAGCGNKEAVTTFGNTEGVWINAGPLDYHIQLSRVLEPGLVPDKSYLTGLPGGTLQPTANEVWFAVFLRVENHSEQPSPTATDFEIVDTTGKTFKPYALNPKVNPFAYQQATLGPKDALPIPDSAPSFDSAQGSELLFKLPLDSYQNRPLEFRIHSANGAAPAEASVDLDV